jgi:phosphatidate cytidylyltransferase
MGETLKRAISGAVYVLLLIASILYSTESFFILFGILLIISLFEFCNLIQVDKLIPIFSGASLYILITLLSNYDQNKTFHIPTLDLILLIITLAISIKCIFFLFDNSNDKRISNFSKYLYLLGYITLPFVFITKITFGVNNYNPKIIIGLLILIWTNDTFAFIVGKSIGKHKLFERISPKKTIEGFFGGLIFAIFAGYLISIFLIKPTAQFENKSILIWLIIAAIVGVIGTIGDLIESKFKRIAGVKDSGRIMPGHGGVLDRLDSVIFAAPFIFLFYKILYYVS